VLALGVQPVGGDDASGQFQRLQQRREPVISLVLPSTARSWVREPHLLPIA
jgi:hypothetical protein